MGYQNAVKIRFIWSVWHYGTAGITAAACIKKIVDVIFKETGPVLVSGSTGGVGSISVGILIKN